MMSLPTFISEYASVEDLRVENDRLVLQADRLLKHTSILEALAQYGKVLPISGSYAYNLMVYPDLDLGITSPDINTKQFSELVKELVGSGFARKVSTANTVDFPPKHPGRPKGYWIRLEIPFEDDIWGIDCWWLRPGGVDSKDEYADKLAQITIAQRDSILAIKHALIFRGLYNKTIFSVDVYDAVLNGSASSVDEIIELSKAKLTS